MRKRSLPRWSPNSLLLAQCSRRLWLSWPPNSLRPPLSHPELLGNTVYHSIALAIKQEKPVSKTISDFLKYWWNQDSIEPLERSKLASDGKIALLNFHQRYFNKQELANTIAVKKNIAVCFSWDGQLALTWQSKKPPGYELFCQVSEIRRRDKTLIIRDFTLKGTKPANEETDFYQKLQLGIYRSCLKPYLEDYNCNEIACEIFDLSNNRIIPIEPFSTGEIHAIVKKAQLRIKGRGQSRDLELCSTCSYKSVCANPYHPPLEWVKTKETPAQLKLSLS